MTAWLLIFSILAQPLSALAEGDGGERDHVADHVKGDDAERAGRDFHEQGDENSDEHGLEEHTSRDGDSYRASYRDHDGVTHELTIEREIQAVAGPERTYAMHDRYRVSVREIPPPREASLGGPVADGALHVQPDGFSSDLDQVREFDRARSEAHPERDQKDVASRAELDEQAARLGSAAREGARLSAEGRARLASDALRVDQAEPGFAPPAVDDLVNAGPDFRQPGPSAPPEPPSARENTIEHLESHTADQSDGPRLNPIEQAVTAGLINEIGAVLTPAFARMSSFISAHKEDLRAGTELAVDLAVAGFPVANLAWGVANLVSVAVQGTTVFGTPVTDATGVALIAIGALAPFEVIEGINQLIRKGFARLGGEAIVEATFELERFENNPLSDIVYHRRVKGEKNVGDFHSFPDIVDNFAGLGKSTKFFGDDGVERTLVTLEGSFRNYEGTFEWIIENNGITVRHRQFIRKMLKSPRQLFMIRNGVRNEDAHRS